MRRLFFVCLFVIGCSEKQPRPSFFLGLAGVRDVWDLEYAEATQVNSFRYDIPWQEVELLKGELQVPPRLSVLTRRGLTDGLSPLPILGYGNQHHGDADYPVSDIERQAFVGYAEFVLDSLPSRVSLWEVWNEWNLAIGMPADTAPGRAEDYVRLLADVYRELKPRYPDHIFVGGSMAGIGRANGWTEAALQAGMLEHLDALSFHPYVFWMNRRNRIPERGMMQLVNELKNQLLRFQKGSEVPLYVTEIGWPTYEGHDGVTLQQQADYIARALLLLRADSRVRGVWVYALKDLGSDPYNREHHFGLLFPDGSPKPAWFSFRDVVSLLRDTVSCELIELNSKDDSAAGVQLVTRAGRRHLVLWALAEDEPRQIELRFQSGPLRAAVSTRIVGHGLGPACALKPGEKGFFELSVTVTSSPLVLLDVGDRWAVVRSQQFEE